MSKIVIEVDVYSAAAIRQVLFEAQKGYSYECVPERIIKLREVIKNLDDSIGAVVES